MEHRRHRDGVRIWSRHLAKALPGQDGSQGAIWISEDISAQKATEARLRQLSGDLDVIPTPIMEIDDKFSVTFMNPAGAAVAGLTPDEVLGKKCYDLFKTPHYKTEKCACARAMQAGAPAVAAAREPGSSGRRSQSTPVNALTSVVFATPRSLTTCFCGMPEATSATASRLNSSV